MTNTFQIKRTWISLGIPFSIILILVLLSKSTFLVDNPAIGSFAITFDLLITAPLVYYLLIRKSKIPVTTVVPILIVGLVVGTYVLPIENQYYLNLFKIWGLPIVELFVLSFVIIKVRRSVNTYKQKKQGNTDFYSTLKETCSELIPQKLVPFLCTEIAVIYYGFLNWKKHSPKTNEFTYHKNSGTTALIWAIIFMVLVETFVLHILLVRWSNLAAWILSALSIYTAIQLFGFLKSLSQRPITISNNNLIVRYGILAETEIKLQDIDLIELSTSDLKSDKQTKKLSAFGELESHNTIIKLKKEYSLFGLYGIRKKFTNLALYLDDKNEFKNKMEEILRQKTENTNE
jgi:hypothetical protein